MDEFTIIPTHPIRWLGTNRYTFIPALAKTSVNIALTMQIGISLSGKMTTKVYCPDHRIKNTYIVFFFRSLAVNALWHGPDNDISGEKGSTKRNWPVLEKNGKSSHTPKPKRTKTTRKSPSQTCVSSPKQQSNKTNGARPNKKHPQLICRKIQRQLSLHPNQKHAEN